ncbi:hypothetical protein [Prosthecobacter sp.]|uniref:hypothetical protein n=1 Tax=Prosthecobacter sp. TaxID=1965333 RepID=UPI003784DE40
MNSHFRAARLYEGFLLSGNSRAGQVVAEKCRFQALRERRRRERAANPSCAEDIRIRIEEPARLHRARHDRLAARMRGKCRIAAWVLTTLVLMVLAWKAGGGQHISPERWVCGLLAGWFTLFMFRAAVFIWQAAPRFVCCEHGQVQVSGLGRLTKAQILNWSIEHQVRIHGRSPRGARLQICCRRLGGERHWTMLMDEGQETERLQRLLEQLLPRTVKNNATPTRETLPMAEGILSQ